MSFFNEKQPTQEDFLDAYTEQICRSFHVLENLMDLSEIISMTQSMRVDSVATQEGQRNFFESMAPGYAAILQDIYEQTKANWIADHPKAKGVMVDLYSPRATAYGQYISASFGAAVGRRLNLKQR